MSRTASLKGAAATTRCWYVAAAALVVASVMMACRPSAEVPSAFDPRMVARVSIERTLPGPSATTYGGSVAHTPTEVEEALIQELAPAKHSLALDRVARAVAMLMTDEARVPSGLLPLLMAWSGLTDPFPDLVVVDIPASAGPCARRLEKPCWPGVQEWSRAARTRLEGSAQIIGVGAASLSDARTRLVAVVAQRWIELEPFPAIAEPGTSVTVRGRLEVSRTAPRFEIVGPAGDWMTIPMVPDEDGLVSGAVPCGAEPGLKHVDIVAEASSLNEIVASFPLYCGQALPTAIESFVESVGAAVEAEELAKVSFEQINDSRTRRGVEPLRWSPALAELAQQHSVAMSKTGSVTAKAPRPTGADIDCITTYQNVASAYGPLEAHTSLMQSALTRGPLLSERVTHGGVGVVLGPPSTNAADPRRIWVTQVLCDGIEPLGPIEELELKLKERDEAVGVAKAESELRRRLEVEPDDAQAWGGLAEIQLLGTGSVEDGLVSATRCTQLSPELAPCWLLRGLALELLDDDETALEAYREYLERSPQGVQADFAREALRRIAE